MALKTKTVAQSQTEWAEILWVGVDWEVEKDWKLTEILFLNIIVMLRETGDDWMKEMLPRPTTI